MKWSLGPSIIHCLKYLYKASWQEQLALVRKRCFLWQMRVFTCLFCFVFSLCQIALVFIFLFFQISGLCYEITDIVDSYNLYIYVCWWLKKKKIIYKRRSMLLMGKSASATVIVIIIAIETFNIHFIQPSVWGVFGPYAWCKNNVVLWRLNCCASKEKENLKFRAKISQVLRNQFVLKSKVLHVLSHRDY